MAALTHDARRPSRPGRPLATGLGLAALSQIKKSPEKFSGKPFATAGVIIGGLTVLFYLLILLWVILNGALR